MSTVSILAANYNNGRYLDAFFSSLLICESIDQIVFIDDGSTDDSLSVARRYTKPFAGRLIIVAQNNKGFANALNRGLSMIDTDYVARIDPDDIAYPSRFVKQKSYLDENIDIAAVGSNAQYISEIGRNLSSTSFQSSSDWIQRVYKLGANGLLHGTSMIRTSVLKRYSYSQRAVPAEDYLLFAQMIKDGFILSNLSEKLTAVRIHSTSVSNFLPFKTSYKTLAIAEYLFGNRSSIIKILTDHYHLSFYRKYLFRKGLTRYFWLMFSALLRPSKIVNRFRYILGADINQAIQ